MMKWGLAGLAATVASVTAMPEPAQAREVYLSEIGTFAGNYCPRGWAKAEGQILLIERHQALFSLLGTTYGGDGRRTFALPDLNRQGRDRGGRAHPLTCIVIEGRFPPRS